MPVCYAPTSPESTFRFEDQKYWYGRKVFFKSAPRRVMDAMRGFAAGVMVAASCWPRRRFCPSAWQRPQARYYVVVEELIPETVRSGTIDIASLGFIAGFTVMMTLDNALG